MGSEIDWYPSMGQIHLYRAYPHTAYEPGLLPI